jgi:hypothetical protein
VEVSQEMMNISCSLLNLFRIGQAIFLFDVLPVSLYADYPARGENAFIRSIRVRIHWYSESARECFEEHRHYRKQRRRLSCLLQDSSLNDAWFEEYERRYLEFH